MNTHRQLMRISRYTHLLAVVGLTVGLGACSALDSDKVDYRSATKGPALDVPPDLTQLSRENRYVVPGSAVTASGFKAAQPAASNLPTAAASLGDVRIERNGSQRWLTVERSPESLWQPLRDFWKEGGFVLTLDQPPLGIMETDWAENRAKIPQDFIRSTLGKLFDNLYSTGERDRFRTRLERNAKGETEIYISHRGMVEVYGDKQQTSTVWQPRANDPELEAEFLRRLMVKLGSSPDQAKAVSATAPTVPARTARLSTGQGQPVLELDDPFERAWRRVGLALDRTGFTVEDRDRSKGQYFVRYVPPTDKTEPGLFSKLFGSGNATGQPLKYRIAVVSRDAATWVSVQTAEGAAVGATQAQRILKVIADDLQ